MSLEDRLKSTLERHADEVRPAPGSLGRANVRLRRAQRRRAAGGMLLVALVGVTGWAVAGRLTGSDDIRPQPPLWRRPTTPPESTGKAVFSALFVTPRKGVVWGGSEGTQLRQPRFALTLDGGATWKPITQVDEALNDHIPTIARAGKNIVAATDVDASTIRIIRFPLVSCTNCAEVSDFHPRTRAPDVYQRVWLSFVTPQQGWMLVGLTAGETSEGELYRTADGGKTWTFKGMSPSGELAFVTPDVAFIAGGPWGASLYRSVDGGTTWKDVAPTLASGCSRNEAGMPLPHFFDARRGVFAQSLSCGGVGYDRIEVWVTSDGGATWTLRSTSALPNPTYPGRLSVIDENAFFVANGKTLLRSSDGGKTFVTIEKDTGLMLFDLRFIDAGFGWMLAQRGGCVAKSCAGTDPPRLYVTRDGGRSLRAIDVRF